MKDLPNKIGFKYLQDITGNSPDSSVFLTTASFLFYFLIDLRLMLMHSSSDLMCSAAARLSSSCVDGRVSNPALNNRQSEM